jgi:hypothetical protein
VRFIGTIQERVEPDVFKGITVYGGSCSGGGSGSYVNPTTEYQKNLIDMKRDRPGQIFWLISPHDMTEPSSYYSMEYLRQGFIALSIDDSLFLPGSLSSLQLRNLPEKYFRELPHLTSWINHLNSWKQKMLSEMSHSHSHSHSEGKSILSKFLNGLSYGFSFGNDFLQTYTDDATKDPVVKTWLQKNVSGLFEFMWSLRSETKCDNFDWTGNSTRTLSKQCGWPHICPSCQKSRNYFHISQVLVLAKVLVHLYNFGSIRLSDKFLCVVFPFFHLFPHLLVVVKRPPNSQYRPQI